MQDEEILNLEKNLAQFVGTQNYYRHALGHFMYTEGVKYLAETAQCYWLLDVIASYILKPKIKRIPFQLWELRVNKNKSATVTMREDSDMPAVVKQQIPVTNFPLEAIKLYCVDGVLMLPSEY